MTEPVAPITDAELAAVEEAVGRMTPGPWIPQQLPNGQWFVAGSPLPPHLAFNTDILGEDDYDTKEDDAKAISLLRNHFAAIIARLNEERARRKRAEELTAARAELDAAVREEREACADELRRFIIAVAGEHYADQHIGCYFDDAIAAIQSRGTTGGQS